MPDVSGNPSDPTEHQPPVTGAELGEPRPRFEATTENDLGPPTTPATEQQTVSLSPDKTGDWQPTPVVNYVKRPGASDAPTVLIGDDQADSPSESRVRYIGDYELLNVVGKGGMGVVYRARQVSLNRVVALKLIRLDGSSSEVETRRFQHEAEAVASLDHPAIVPIYEVGIHEGRHYFSMKLIVGESLQQASPRLRSHFKAIGRIVTGASRAVQHAHERGILHRDLKPANILLDESDIPHVNDFGLAKRIDTGDSDATQSDAILGTPAYMAPEQATASRGAITIATDVYGLGAILYALLSGHAPYRGSSILEILDAVRESTPEAPSKADATIPRDLDVICMKCLNKDPRRRYHSAGDLADDLDRWLEGRPITARHVSPVARAALWCRRRPLVAGLAAALVMAVSLGTAALLINWINVRRANVQIRAEWETSRQINEFLVTDMLGQSSPFASGRPDVPVSALLDRSAALAASRFVNQPKIEGAIRQALGFAYLVLGKFPKAEAELLHSFRLRQTLPEGDELDRLATEHLLAMLRLEQGRYDEAEAHAVKAHEGRLRLLGGADATTLESAEVLAAALRMKGKLDEARKLLERTNAAAEEVLGKEHRLTLRTLTDLAVIADAQARYPEAIAVFRQNVIANTRLFGADHPETLVVRSMLGSTLINSGGEAQADEILEAALEPAREVLGPNHPETLRISGNLALARSRLKKYDEATKGIDQTIQAQRDMGAANDPDTLANEISRVAILMEQLKLAEADQILRELIPRLRTYLKEDDTLLGIGLACRASALWDLNRTPEAEPLNAEAIEIFRKKLPAEHPQVVSTEANHAHILLANGKPIEAEKLAARVVEIRSRPDWVGNPARLGASKSALGGALAAQKRFAEAEPLLLEGFRLIDSDPKAIARRRVDAVERLIQFYESQGKIEEAARWRERRAL